MLLADTGPLVAVANAKDQQHAACRELLETHPGPIAVPAPVIVEVCQLLAVRGGTHGEAAFLASLGAGELEVVDLEPADYMRGGELVKRYADLPLGAVDATVIAVAVACTSPRSPPWTGATSPSSVPHTPARSHFFPSRLPTA